MKSREAISRIVGFTPFGQALHGKQQLMLLRFDSMFFRSRLAEMKESPDLPAELRQIAILILGLSRPPCPQLYRITIHSALAGRRRPGPWPHRLRARVGGRGAPKRLTG